MKKAIMVSLFMVAVLTAAVAASDGAALYGKCKPCHGADGSKVPVGAAKAVKGMSAADLEKALTGYQAGTFGGDKKATMERIAKGLSADDVKALSDYISKF